MNKKPIRKVKSIRQNPELTDSIAKIKSNISHSIKYYKNISREESGRWKDIYSGRLDGLQIALDFINEELK